MRQMRDEIIEQAARAMWLEEVVDQPTIYQVRLNAFFEHELSAPKWRRLARAALSQIGPIDYPSVTGPGENPYK
jgi:hypothetical protein